MKITLDARVSSYSGPSSRILGVCDSQNRTVLVAKKAEYKTTGKVAEHTVIVTDSPEHHEDWSLAFYESQHLSLAIRAYKELNDAGRVSISQNIQQRPDAILQLRKIDEKGSKLELDSGAITNDHVAVLLLVWAAHKAMVGERIANMTVDRSLDPEVDDDDGEDDSFMPFSIVPTA